MKVFWIMLKAGLNDRISLIWSVVFPVAILLTGRVFIQDEILGWYFLVGVLAISALSYGLMGTAFDYFTHRSTDVFKIVALSRTGIGLFLFYYTFARLLVTIIGLFLIFSVGTFILQISANIINPMGLILYLFFLALSSNLMGIISANHGKNAGGIATITNIIMIMMIASSSLFYSSELLPDWLAKIFRFSPLEVMADLAKAASTEVFAIIYAALFSAILALAAFLTFARE